MRRGRAACGRHLERYEAGNSSHLILTRFQPGGLSCHWGSNRFNGFRIRWSTGKPLKRFSEIRWARRHPVETGCE